MQETDRDLGGAAPLLRAALQQFAAFGFEGASLQRIAAEAGLSKSSVLYHFASKEALLDAALRPAVDDLRALVDRMVALHDDADRRRFAAGFVDYLYEHRLALAVLVNFGQSLAGHRAIDDADALVRELSVRLTPATADPLDVTRFGVALAGAAFMLIAADRWSPDHLPEDSLRVALQQVVGDLVLGPVGAA